MTWWKTCQQFQPPPPPFGQWSKINILLRKSYSCDTSARTTGILEKVIFFRKYQWPMKYYIGKNLAYRTPLLLIHYTKHNILLNYMSTNRHKYLFALVCHTLWRRWHVLDVIAQLKVGVGKAKITERSSFDHDNWSWNLYWLFFFNNRHLVRIHHCLKWRFFFFNDETESWKHCHGEFGTNTESYD